MYEAVLVGKAKRVDFDEDIIKRNIQIVRKFHYETKTFFQRDFEKKNKQDERDIFGETLIRLAKEYKVSIAVIAEIYGTLLER